MVTWLLLTIFMALSALCQALRSLAPEFKYLESRVRLMMATVLPWVLPETQQLIDYYRLRFENDLDAIRNDSAF